MNQFLTSKTIFDRLKEQADSIEGIQFEQGCIKFLENSAFPFLMSDGTECHGAMIAPFSQSTSWGYVDPPVTNTRISSHFQLFMGDGFGMEIYAPTILESVHFPNKTNEFRQAFWPTSWPSFKSF